MRLEESLSLGLRGDTRLHKHTHPGSRVPEWEEKRPMALRSLLRIIIISNQPLEGVFENVRQSVGV